MNIQSKLYLGLLVYILFMVSCSAQNPAIIYYKKAAAEVKPDTVQKSVESKKDLRKLVEDAKTVKENEPLVAVNEKMGKKMLDGVLLRMSFIPNIFDLGKDGTVHVIFGSTADGKNSNQLVSKDLTMALQKALEKANKELPESHKIKEIYVSSTTNGRHSRKSNHYYGTAVDISRINGIRMTELGSNSQVRALQKALDESPIVRENFGPHLKTKTYIDGTSQSVYVRGHYDHIHFSIQGEHNAEVCECPDSIEHFHGNPNKKKKEEEKPSDSKSDEKEEKAQE